VAVIAKTVHLYERLGRDVGTSASIFTDENYHYVTVPSIPTRCLVRISKTGAYGSVKL